MQIDFKNLYFIVLILLFAGCKEKSTFPNGTWVDLSYAYDSETIYWPTASGYKLDTVFEGTTEEGYYYSAFNISTAEHGGTHLDAPIHFARGQQSVEQLSINQLSGEAIVVDISVASMNNADYRLKVEDLQKWEETNGAMPKDVILLVRTGYGKYWPDRLKYLGTDKVGPEAVNDLHFPGISEEAAKWLVENRSIKAIGIDTPSIDFGQSKDFISHRIFYESNIPGFENVANLDMLPIKGIWIIALPMKIKGGSGAPLRIAALIN